jgi:hypothetical protein
MNANMLLLFAAPGECNNVVKPNGTACPATRHVARRPCATLQWQCYSGVCAAKWTAEQKGTRCTDSDKCTVRQQTYSHCLKRMDLEYCAVKYSLGYLAAV